MSAVLLIDPKFPQNVGNVIRSCSIFGVEELMWTGFRVPHPDKWPTGFRLPREARMGLYKNIKLTGGLDRPLPELCGIYTPVVVEVSDRAELLPYFIHPKNAVYIFGPEDGYVPKGMRTAGHRFVVIPTTTCLNLSNAVSIVLYDRMAKEMINV
jgi:tRNA(Leu) C34 or U34 (ribose-2'-O)-methylase TrmL